MHKCRFILQGMFILSLVFSLNTSAAEIGMLLPGLSYHIGSNSSNPAFTDAPRRLDKNGAFVFNPGAGLVYDSRDKADGSSLSWSAMGIYFRDCNDKAVYSGGVGGRYRYYLNDKFSIDGDLYLSLFRAQDWDTKEYSNSFMPFPSIGVNYHFDRISLGLKTTFSPRNKNHSSTGSFNLLFSYFYIGYSL